MDEKQVGEKKYTVTTSGYRISEFLDMVIGDMGLELSFDLLEGQHLHPDLEDPDILGEIFRAGCRSVAGQ